MSKSKASFVKGGTKKDFAVVETVADLKKLTNMRIGASVTLEGYYAAGDGGGGTFEIQSSGTADDGITFALDDGLFAVRLYDGLVNARWFGAKGDNVTDDTSAIDAAQTEGITSLTNGQYNYAGALDVSKIVASASAKLSSNSTTSLPLRVVNIPTDFPNLQAALEFLGRAQGQFRYKLNIETGHALTVGVYLKGGDYSNFEITSDDATVSLDAGFVGSNNADADGSEMVDDSLFVGRNCWMPRIRAKFDMNQNGSWGDGVWVENATIYIDSGKGVINAGRRGIQAREASHIHGVGSDFSGANWNGIKAQHGVVAALNACIMSGCCKNLGSFPGPGEFHAAAYFSKGCFVSFRSSDVSDSGANGLEVRRSFVDAEEIDANGAAGDSSQFPKGCLVAQAGAYVIATSANLSGGHTGIHSLADSKVAARGADCSGSSNFAAYIRTGSWVDLTNVNCADQGITTEGTVEIVTGGTQTNNSPTQTSGTLETTGDAGDDVLYRITNYVAGDDFTNVGASSNATGEFFKATGTTPTDWTNGSTLTRAIAVISDFSQVNGSIPSFNNQSPMGMISSKDHNVWERFTPRLTDQSGNDVEDNGGSYGIRLGLFRLIDQDLVEYEIQVNVAVKGGNVVAGDRIKIPDDMDINLSEAHFPSCSFNNSGLTLDGETALAAIHLTDGTIQFNSVGAGGNSPRNWSDVTGAFGITVKGIAELA